MCAYNAKIVVNYWLSYVVSKRVAVAAPKVRGWFGA
jgi:hypothetical protein